MRPTDMGHDPQIRNPYPKNKSFRKNSKKKPGQNTKIQDVKARDTEGKECLLLLVPKTMLTNPRNGLSVPDNTDKHLNGV